MKHYDYSIIYKYPHNGSYQMAHIDAYAPINRLRVHILIYYPDYGLEFADISPQSCEYFIPTYHLQVKQDVIEKLQHDRRIRIDISEYKTKEIQLYLDRCNRFIRKSIDKIERITRKLPVFERTKFIVIQNRNGSDHYLCRLLTFYSGVVYVERYIRI